MNTFMSMFSPKTGKKFGASAILPGLYLGAEADASNLEGLKEHKIGWILNVANDVQDFFPGQFNYLRLEVKDMGMDQGISRVFDSGISFVKDRKDNKGNDGVLIHCKYGMNRSATMMIAVVMELQGWSLRETVEHVKKRRPVITPLSDNQRELAAFEVKLRGHSDPPLAWRYNLDPKYYAATTATAATSNASPSAITAVTAVTAVAAEGGGEATGAKELI
jgi:hypothetical protein